jgi:hypothetical protein
MPACVPDLAEKQIARSGKLGARPSKSCSNECFRHSVMENQQKNNKE